LRGGRFRNISDLVRGSEGERGRPGGMEANFFGTTRIKRVLNEDARAAEAKKAT